MRIIEVELVQAMGELIVGLTDTAVSQVSFVFTRGLVHYKPRPDQPWFARTPLQANANRHPHMLFQCEALRFTVKQV